METTNTKRYLTPAETSRILKKDLRATFPGTKFSVKLSGSYGTICISWVDGPDEQAVYDYACAGYKTKSFDGMTDSTVYSQKTIDVDGEACESGASYIFTRRDRS